MTNQLSWEDFDKIEMRVGTVIKVEDFPKARKPAYRLWIDFGSEIGLKKSSAQITERYTKEQLINRQIIAVVNFPEKQIANFKSQCLVLGVVNGTDVILLEPGLPVQNGLRIS